MQAFFDNINSKVVDDLRVSIKKGTKLSIASACFSIYAFEELKSQLQGIDELRFIFTAPSFLKDGESKQRREFYIPRIDRERALYGSQFEVKLRNQLTQKAIAIECADWIRQKVKFKSNVTSANMLGFINIENEEPATYTPVNGFTTTDLGCEKGNNMFNFVNKVEAENSRQYGGKITAGDGDEEPKENRYLKLLNKVIRTGVKTKVLMLSATPVNNRFNDLKNQLQLAYEGDVEQMDSKLNTSSSLEDIFRQAQRSYNSWAKLPAEQRTTDRLLGMLSFDFFEVLDSVTIARSRKHIEAYYDTEAIGKFPTRLPPISRRPHLTDLKDAINYNEIFEQLQKLNLAIYTPSEFILPSKAVKYKLYIGDGKNGLSLEGREMGIRRLMCILMLKRLESSVNSFRLTLERVETLIKSTIEHIDNHDAEINVEEAQGYDFDIDDIENEAFIGTKKNKILLEDMDYISWRKYLQEDYEELELTRLMLADITPEHDCKLQQLIEDLRNKFENPINGQNKKVIIFTAFSDTAVYLYDNLADRIQKKYGMDTALVTGDVEARSNAKGIGKLDFNKVLTLFSPVSKEKEIIYPDIKNEIEVLIATDCISEGQNLQDCDYLINYDIHWNPVRIIQRFGRIDRIGSKNDVIQLVNFWPDMTLDEYIDLDVILKRPDYDPKNIQLLSKLIPQNIIFAMRYEDRIQLAVYHTKLITGVWAKADNYQIEFKGLNLDKIWENLITDLERKARSEKQPRKRLELFEQLKSLRSKYEAE